MPVAKSFQSYTQIGDVFMSGGKQYVNMKNPSTGTIRKCRWYSDAEYARYYPEVKVIKAGKTQKEVLGFEKGYITIFKGNCYEDREWFKQSSARYTRLWGWYFISTEELPADLPTDVTPIQLKWEDVGGEDGKLFTDAKVKAFVDTLLYDEDPSEYAGEIGERIELTVTVVKTFDMDSQFGASTMHTFKDENGNVFLWTTASKKWEVGTVHHIRGTVKDHKIFRNCKETILSRCMEI